MNGLEKKTTELAASKDMVPAHQRALLQAGGAVHAIIPATLEQAFRLAEWIAGAGWAPKGYKDSSGNFDANKIAVGILHGLEVGFTPIAALQSIAVINGMPSIYGDGALALVQASGLMEDFDEFPILEGTKVVGYKFWSKRRGRKSAITQQFTKADAERAKLIGKEGPWTNYEQRMYQMRARAWGLRDGYADVLRGLSIAEEAMDIIDVTPANIPPAIEGPKAKVPGPEDADLDDGKDKAESASTGNAASGQQAARPEPEPYTPTTGRAEPPTHAAQPEPVSKNGDGKPLSATQKSILKNSLTRAGLNELDLTTKFGVGIDGIKTADFNKVSAWIAERAS